ALLDLALLLIHRLALFVREAGAAAEALRIDDDAFDAAGHLEAVVFDIFAGPAEDRMQQLLFRRQFALRFRRDFADEDVARIDERADADDAVVVEIRQ